jgi:hypothetical protein
MMLMILAIYIPPCHTHAALDLILTVSDVVVILAMKVKPVALVK